ncbi:MAG TPA: phosphoribosylglycinamide formyltransferase [Burkholderiaceae bacterium]|nr:phosphoribosylglycinamide formyltransferase [Burkholderiaceae bacterium]
MADLEKPACRFVILISGRGSNMQTIVETIEREALPAQVCAVIANRADAAGLQWARERGLAVHAVPHRDYPDRESFDRALAEVIDGYDPHYVLLAGFMRVLTPPFVERYEGRLINIHPSLLPSFPGLHTHQQALTLGVQWHGCTVHFVTAQLDHGPVVAQGVVPVLADDDADALASRLLAVEHRMYAQVVRWLAEGRVTLDKQHVRITGAPTRAFLPDGTLCGGHGKEQS